MWRGWEMGLICALALLAYLLLVVFSLVVQLADSRGSSVSEQKVEGEPGVVKRNGFKVVVSTHHGEMSPEYREMLKTWPKTDSSANGWTWASLGVPSALLGCEIVERIRFNKAWATTSRPLWVDSKSFKSGAHKSVPDRAGLRPSDTAKADCQLAKLGLWGSRANARGPRTLGDHFDHTHLHFWTTVQISYHYLPGHFLFLPCCLFLIFFLLTYSCLGLLFVGADSFWSVKCSKVHLALSLTRWWLSCHLGCFLL